MLVKQSSLRDWWKRRSTGGCLQRKGKDEVGVEVDTIRRPYRFELSNGDVASKGTPNGYDILVHVNVPEARHGVTFELSKAGEAWNPECACGGRHVGGRISIEEVTYDFINMGRRIQQPAVNQVSMLLQRGEEVEQRYSRRSQFCPDLAAWDLKPEPRYLFDNSVVLVS